jgi:hypothetical protein
LSTKRNRNKIRKSVRTKAFLSPFEFSPTATKFLGEMSKGYCHPKLFECNDGRRYVVKLMSNPQGLRGLPNELIACRLGNLLKLPIVPGRIVYLTKELIKNDRELKQQRVQPGPHFGSLYIEKVQEPSRHNIKKCVNLHQGVDMIVFDHWIHRRTFSVASRKGRRFFYK